MESEIVDKFYTLNRETEILFADGTWLMDGMVVLAGSPDDRYMSDMPTSARYFLNMANRWCEVSFVQTWFRDDGVTLQFITFIATYADGTQLPRKEAAWKSWIVKRDSLPVIEGTDWSKLEYLESTPPRNIPEKTLKTQKLHTPFLGVRRSNDEFKNQNEPGRFDGDILRGYVDKPPAH